MNSKILAVFLVALFSVVISTPLSDEKLMGESTQIEVITFYDDYLTHFHLSLRYKTLFDCGIRTICNSR